MSDFKARIIAELDTSKAEQQINQLGKDKKVKIDADTNNAQKNINNLNSGMKNAGNTAQSVGKTLKNSLDIGSSAAIAYKGIRLIEESARDAYEAIKDFDGAITDLRMATNDSYDSVRNLVKNYNEMGKSLGANTTEVTDSADAWLRQGHTIEDTNTLIKDSMILSKVSSLDSADATEYLTSAMKGYKVAVEDVIGIVDKLTAVDLVSATDAGGLAEAMSRTAVTADMAGVSMDKLLGYLAVVGETTGKNMSSVGESFKTIFTRMSDIKADKLELVDSDGTVELLSDVESSLADVGISLRQTVNEYNSYGEVLDALAEKWDALSQDQQNKIAKAFAGTRQSENFRVLMENYSKAQEYMNTALNSTGTAEQKFDAYLDSIEAKLNTLQASFESLAFNVVSTELVSGVIEASTAVLEFLDNTNLLKGALVGLATAGAIKGFTMLATGVSNAAIKLNDFNSALKLIKAGNIGTDEIQQLASMTANLSQSQLKAVLSSKALTTEQRIAILTSQGMSSAEAKATLSTMGLATAEGTATAATFSLSGAFKGLWATLMANPLVLVVAGVTAAVSAYATYKQKAEEARQATLDVGSAAKTEADNIKDLYNAYSLASDAYASNTGSKEEL
ncbi:MAG: phage tail tape measure protein, partial [Tyzzerella sp.]|nr:phage tail tape measure protein [Tyzzerella sp.]